MITNYGVTHEGNVIHTKYGKDRLLAIVPLVSDPQFRIEVAYLDN